jgi:hypothetical protein
MSTRKLGFGDFVHAGPNLLGRSLYLHAVSRMVPATLAELVALDFQNPEAIHAWARMRGFEDAWALDCARRHAEYWRNDPTMLGHWIISGATWEPVFPAGPSWNPTTETEQGFRKRVEGYIRVVKSAPGIKRAPEKRASQRKVKKIKPGQEQHFEWLALHHAGRKTEAEIAERYPEGLNIGSISEAITTSAALIGLTLRPAPGRNFGQRTIP